VESGLNVRADLQAGHLYTLDSLDFGGNLNGFPVHVTDHVTAV